MHDLDTDRRQSIGLFRYGLIADLLQLPPGGKGLYERLAAKAALDYTIPGSRRTRVAAETLRDWLKAYRRGGFEALLPKERADRGQVRALPAAVAEALLAVKEDNRNLSVQLVIRTARQSPECRTASACLTRDQPQTHRISACHWRHSRRGRRVALHLRFISRRSLRVSSLKASISSLNARISASARIWD